MSFRHTLALDGLVWVAGSLPCTSAQLDYVEERTQAAYDAAYAAQYEAYLAADHTDEAAVTHEGGGTYINGIGTPARAAYLARGAGYEAARTAARTAGERLAVFESLAA